MSPLKSSSCGRFVVLDGLHVDRAVYDEFARCAAEHGLRVQDAVQLALVAFEDAIGSISSRDVLREGRGEQTFVHVAPARE